VRVLSFERLRGKPALVLEYVEGTSLVDLERGGRLSRADIVEILTQIEAGLLDLHKHGLFHGDLSPHNVMIDVTGHVRLLDFGFANGGRDEPDRLTPEFAAPERLAGGGVPDLNADLFSLGRIEQFLRGQAIAGCDDNSTYLRARPEQRRPRQVPSRARQRQTLALRVREALENRRRTEALRTRTRAPTPVADEHGKAAGMHAITARARTLLSGLTLAGLLMVTSAAAPMSRPRLAVLSLRARAWHYFLLDGMPLGYAPLTVAVEADTDHRLEWISAAGRGERHLRLSRDQRITWADRDFSH
jgi:hypothetical protein